MFLKINVVSECLDITLDDPIYIQQHAEVTVNLHYMISLDNREVRLTNNVVYIVTKKEMQRILSVLSFCDKLY